jgi:hypothetical protein
MSEAKPDSGRDDYNAAAHFTQLEPGEPYFLIRGRDALGAAAVRAWAALAYEAFVPMAVVEKSLQQADAIEAWPVKKRPDAAHLTDAEVLQLAFQLERRAWNAREDSADPRIMLAEERALTAAMSRMRPLLATLLSGLTDMGGGTWCYAPPIDSLGKPIDAPCPIEGLRRLSVVLRGQGPSDG